MKEDGDGGGSIIVGALFWEGAMRHVVHDPHPFVVVHLYP